MNNTLSNLHAPALLIIGSRQQTHDYAVHMLQHALCPNGGCCCVTCTQIARQQHHQILWLTPDPTYTLQTFEPLFETVSRANADDQHFFFVIPHADFLSAACANRLLKVVEEPPPGYHFLFLAQRPAQVIVTIRSRCLIETLPAVSQNEYPTHPLFTLFTLGPLDPSTLLTIVEKHTPNETESIELVDALLAYWSRSDQPHARAIVQHLQHALKQPPMPGSSKLFWRSIFMRLNQARTGSTTPPTQ